MPSSLFPEAVVDLTNAKSPTTTIPLRVFPEATTFVTLSLSTPLIARRPYSKPRRTPFSILTPS